MTYPAWPEGGADRLEQDLLERWRAERLFHQTLAATRGGRPFVFYEGPPTANGRPGIHHVFARTIKDLICRFRVMQGHAVTRIAERHGATAHQVVLAWLLARSPSILPIPGTGSVPHLEDNVAAASLELSGAEVVELTAAAR